MKIAIIHYSAPPVVGGVESVISHHARLMAEAGLDTRILAGTGAQTNPRVQFYHIPLASSRHPDILSAKKNLDRGIVPPEFGSLVSSLVQSLQQHFQQVDLVIAHNIASLHKNLALTTAIHMLNQQNKIPRLILWQHDLAWTTPRYQAELYPGFPWSLIREDWPGATQVTISSFRQRELANLLRIGTDRVDVVPSGVDFNLFLKLESQTQAIVKEFNLFEAMPLLLLPVRITPRKNIELALHTLAQLRISYPRARMLVTGPPGPHNPTNINYLYHLLQIRTDLGLQEAAHFLTAWAQDFLPDEVIFDCFKLSDALLLPSREEGFGIPILEAGLAGIPIFCTDIPPLRELAGDSASYFSPDADPAYISALLCNHFDQDLTYHLRARVRMSYSWEKVYQDYIAPLLGVSG